MSVALNQSVQPATLHIAGSSSIDSPETMAVEQWIAQAGMEVGRCPDVYLGLARVLGNSQGDFSAAVVCVENLATDEFEFFSLVARARRDLPVLVYGSRTPDRVVRALQAGAKGLATRDAVLALGAKFERLAQPAESASAAPSSPSVPAVIAQLVPSPPAEQTKEGEDEPHEDADASATARVPWLRYNGGPARQAPSNKIEREEPADQSCAVESDVNGKSGMTQGKGARTGEDSVETCPGESHEARQRINSAEFERSYEPLLTEQELAALLGDDLDDLALQEREMLTGEGEVPGSGTR